MPKWNHFLRFMCRHGYNRREGDHHYFKYRRKDGKEIDVRISHGSGEIPRPVWKSILKDLGITQEEFNRG